MFVVQVFNIFIWYIINKNRVILLKDEKFDCDLFMINPFPNDRF